MFNLIFFCLQFQMYELLKKFHYSNISFTLKLKSKLFIIGKQSEKFLSFIGITALHYSMLHK